MNSMNDLLNRRQVLNRFGMGLGGLALNEMLAKEAVPPDHGVLGGTHAPPKAKRIIYLFMSGGPSHLDLYDHKPLLNQRQGEQLPDSVRGTQRLTGMSGNQSSIPMVGSPFKFTQHGQAGAMVLASCCRTRPSIADDLCVMRSMFTESINHGPGVTFFPDGLADRRTTQHGRLAQLWTRCGQRKPAEFHRADHERKGGQPLGAHLWGSGFLPTKHQGVLFRAAKDPVLYLGNPDGVTHAQPSPAAGPAEGAARASVRRHAGRRDPEPDRSLRDGLPHAEQRPGGHRHRATSRSTSSTVRAGCEDARHLCRELPAGAAHSPSAACVSSSSTIRTGTTTAACPPPCRELCKETDQPARPW
jgi:hypothetical protein